MTTASADGGLDLRDLERKLLIKHGQSVVVINAPIESRLRLLASGNTDPVHADVVIGFGTRKVDLAWLKAVYAAARAGRLAWVGYPRPGRPGTDLPRGWLLSALRQYGVGSTQDVAIDCVWSALRLCTAGDNHNSVIGGANG